MQILQQFSFENHNYINYLSAFIINGNFCLRGKEIRPLEKYAIAASVAAIASGFNYTLNIDHMLGFYVHFLF